MASGSTSKDYKLAIKIAGKVDSSLGSAVGNAQSTLSKLGSFVGTIAKTAAVAIGAATTAAVAFAKTAVDAGMEFDTAMSQVAATMGTTTDQISDLRDFAMEMGSKTAFSATEAAEALNYMALAGYDAETSMAMLPNVLNLAAAGAIDLASASDMITDAQSALGLTLEQTGIMVDQMAAASSKSNTSVAQLGEAILTVGGTAQYMAGGTKELNTVLGALADNGIKGSEGGTHLRNMLLKLASPTADATKLLKSLGVQIFDAQGNMRSFTEIFPELNVAMSNLTDQERLDAMSTLFNSRDIASATALLSTTTERWEELGAAIEDSAGAAEQMANTQLDNLAGDITLFKSAMEGAQIALSDQLTPTLREFVQFGSNAISTLSDAFKEGGLSGAMEALGGILSDGLSMVIAELPNMIDAGMQLLGALGQGLIDNLPMIIDTAMEVAFMFIDGLVSSLPSIADAAVEIITTLATGLGDALPELVPTIVDIILRIVETLSNPDTQTALLDAALKIMVGLAQGLIKALPRLLEAIPTILVNFATAIIDAIPMLLAALGEIFGPIGDWLGGIFSGAANGLTEMFTPVLNFLAGIWNTIQPVLTSISGAFVAAWELIKAVWEKVAPFFQSMWEVIKGYFQIAASILSGAFKLAWERIKAVFSVAVAVVGGFFNTAWEAVKAIWNNVAAYFRAVFDTIAGIFSAITSVLHEDFAGAWGSIKSVFSSWGNFFQTLWDGVKNVFGSVADWFSGVFTEAWTAVKNVFSAGGEIFVGIVDGILRGFKTVVNGIIGGLNKVIEVPFKGINTALTKIKSIDILGVKPFSWLGTISVPQIPMLAKGGIVDNPTILEAGEAGTEAIVPLGELWRQMQDMISRPLGSMGDRVVSLAERLDALDFGNVSTPISDLLRGLWDDDDDNDGDGPEPQDSTVYHFTYAPQHHFHSGAPTKEDMVEAEHMSQEEFNRKMDQWVKDNARKRF